jgi:hypothetical protein
MDNVQKHNICTQYSAAHGSDGFFPPIVVASGCFLVILVTRGWHKNQNKTMQLT